MKITCLSNVSDNIKSQVSQKLGLPDGVSLKKETLILLTEQYCIENNIDTIDHINNESEIADFIVSQLDINNQKEALSLNMVNGTNVSEYEYDQFYEQNQMLLNEPIEDTPENRMLARDAQQVFTFSNIIELSDGRIMITFPEVTFGKIHESPYKLTRDEKSKGYTQEMKEIKVTAIENGTFMKVRNPSTGELVDSNLNEKQWLQVRTKAFKEWFGDWENPTIFTANNVDDVEALQQKYPSDLPNKFYHHSTNKFGRQAFDSREGNKERLHIIGRLTTDKVDVLVVENPNSDNKISHITLATAESIKPVESNRELENNQDKIQPLDDYVDTTFTNNLRSDVSKVVDENGEPLVVYHHTNNPNLTEFSTDFENYFTKDGGTKEAIFFDENETGTLNRKYDIPVFLNIKDLHEYNETKEQLHQRGTTYRQIVNESAASNNVDGGVHMKDFDDNKMEHQSIWIVHNPNQIKSATDNNGEFSEQNDNIYYERDSRPIVNTVDNELQQLKPSRIRISEMFDKSKNINSVLNLLRERGQYNAILDLIDSSKSGLKERLSDVEIQFDIVNQQSNKTLYNSYRGRRAYYDSTDKIIHIDINAPYINGDASSVIMHEIMHAITLDLLKSNPEQAAKLRKIMDEYSKKIDSTRYNTEHGLEEFVADIWSNEKVIEQLKSTKSDDGKASLWKKILDFFNDLFSGRLFGNIENDSLMAQASQELMKLLDMNATERQKGYYFEGENTQNIIISSKGYKKGDPQNNPDTAYIFTENAQAYIYSKTGDLSVSVLGDTLIPKINVSDVNGTNQAGIRTDKSGNLSSNAFGIVVKKRQQDNSGKWLSKEGQFEDSNEDFDLFKDLNNQVFSDIESSGLSKLIFPSQMALGKSALPKRFAEWLQKQLKSRFGISSTIQKNTKAGYNGYGLQINSVDIEQKQQPEQKTIDDYKKELYDLFEFFNKHVVRDENFATNHKYWIINNEGKRHEANSVTESIKSQSKKHKKQFNEGQEHAWTAVGTDFDRFVREFFKHGEDYVRNGIYKCIPASGYKNNDLRERLISKLKAFKKALDDKFQGEYEVITEEISIGAQTSSGYKAGTPDMIILDKDGGIHIYDFKTFSDPKTFEEDQGGYALQVSSYGGIISANIPEGSGLHMTDDIGLFSALVKYPAYDDTHYGDKFEFNVKDGLVVRKEDTSKQNPRSIASYKHFDIEIQVSGKKSDLSSYVKKMQYKTFFDEIKGLDRTEREELKDMPDAGYYEKEQSDPTSTENTLIDTRPDVVFKDDTIVPTSDMVIISDTAVKLVSMYATKLLNDEFGDLAKKLLGYDMVDIGEFGEWTQKPDSVIEFLTRPGVYRKMFESVIGFYFPIFQDEYNDWLNDHINDLVEMSFGTLRKLFSDLVISSSGNVTIRENESETQDIEDQTKGELDAPEEVYDLDKRTVSMKQNMPSQLKRKLFAIPKYEYDANGNVVIGDDGLPVQQRNEFGMPDFVDEDDVLHTLQANLYAINTMSGMKERLRELKDSSPWVQEVLDMLDQKSDKYDKDVDMVFFKTFRKAQTRFCKIYVNNKGEFILIPTNLERKWVRAYENAIKTLLDPDSEETLLYHPDDSDNMFQLNVDSDIYYQMESWIESLDDAINADWFNKNDAYKSIQKILGYLGIHVDEPSLLKKFLVKTIRKSNGKTPQISAKQIYDLIAGDDGLFTYIKSISKDDDGYVELTKDLSASSAAVYTALEKLSKILEPTLGENIETQTRDNDKTYNTYSESSPLQDIVFELRGDGIPSIDSERSYKDGIDDGIFDEKDHRFNRFRQFMRVDNGEIVYMSSWLRKLKNADNKDVLRQKMMHYVHTSTDDKPYLKQNDDQYTTSLLAGYFSPSQIESFGVRNEDFMLCRVPVISDKNSQEWILFEKEAVASSYDEEGMDVFKHDIADSAKEFFYFELQRMKAVLKHLRQGKPENDIKNYHIKRSKGAAIMEHVSREDIVKNGKLADWVIQSGISFRYLPMLNHEIERGTEFGKKVIDMLNAETEQETMDAVGELGRMFDNAFINGMDEAFQVFKSTLSGSVIERVQELSGQIEEDIPYVLQEYFYNDFMATANIFNLTMGDPAFFKDTIDLQKRFAQYHSQTQKVNKEATFEDENGNTKNFSDGKFRYITIATQFFASPLADITRKLFNDLAENEQKTNGKSARYQELKVLSETVPLFFVDKDGNPKVDVTDGQAMHGPTAAWKKLSMLGSVDQKTDNFYRVLKGISQGEFTMKNFTNVIQSMKPVVTGFVETPERSELASEDGTMLVPTYIKDSESLILLAGAIMKGANQNNVLSALYKFVEDSAFNGSEHSLSSYNGIGIDTICFDSAVKTGANNVIDLNDCKTEQEVLDKLNRLCYGRPRNARLRNGASPRRKYTRFIKETDFNNWGIQQNVPEHMQDHEQDLGTQAKVLCFTDLSEDDFKENKELGLEGGVKVNISKAAGIWESKQKTYNDKQTFIRDYLELVKDEFEIGLNELRDMFGLEIHEGQIVVSDKVKFNETLRDMARENIIKDQKYSIELLRAVTALDAAKNFIMPIGDPQIADTLFGFIFTQIKKSVNKQQIPGGPVVQMSPFGLSDKLNIVDGNGQSYRTKDENGNLVRNNNFKPLTGLTYECYITAPTEEIERRITRPDGSIMSIEEILKKGIMSEQELNFIAYRIPTEDKYSIYRMKIKGFVSRRSGEVIIMPQDLTALSGTDFDIDKMYCWFQKIINRSTPVLDERDKIHNDMFNMAWASLGTRSAVEHQLNPGNYDLLKEIASEVSVPTDNDDSLLYPHNQVKIKKDNQAGKNFVGIAALNNTCHGLATFADIRFKSLPSFNIDGVTADSLLQTDDRGNTYFQVDQVYSPFDGFRISKTLSMFVGAAADNAKETLLGKLNITPTTANIVMSLIRIGVPIRTISYMMKTPVVQTIIDDAEAVGGYFESAIEQQFNEMFPDVNSPYEDTEINTEKMGQLIQGTLNNAGYAEQLNGAIVTFLYNMIPYAKGMSSLNTVLSLNSTKNAVGPTIYDTVSKIFKIKQFQAAVEGENFDSRERKGRTVFTEDSYRDLITSVPYLGSLVDAYEYATAICARISPICNDEFFGVIEAMCAFKASDSLTSDKNMKALMNAYLLYRASKIGIYKSDFKSREEMLYDFPIDFFASQERYIGNEFLSALKVDRKMNKYNKVPNIKLDMSQSDINAVNRLSASWNQLVSMGENNPASEEMETLSDKIIQYMTSRFGFMWQPNSAMNVTPSNAKMMFVSDDGIRYVDLFSPNATEGWNPDIDTQRLLMQFALNNPQCGLWQKSTVFKYKDGNTIKYYIPAYSYDRAVFGYKMKGGLYRTKQQKPNTVKRKFKKPDGGETEIECVEVKRLYRLGIDKNFLEYDANDGNIKSVVNKSKFDTYLDKHSDIIEERKQWLESTIDDDRDDDMRGGDEGYFGNEDADNVSPQGLDSQDEVLQSPNEPNKKVDRKELSRLVSEQINGMDDSSLEDSAKEALEKLKSYTKTGNIFDVPTANTIFSIVNDILYGTEDNNKIKELNNILTLLQPLC